MGWNWPGSRWWAFDLHTHTPASYDFGSTIDRQEKNWIRWLEQARDAGLHAVAVTDHNSSGGIDELKRAAEQVANAPIIFPGVELTAACGTHLLIVLDPSKSATHVADLLSKTSVPVDHRGTDAARSPLSIEQVMGLGIDDAVFIAAHINGPKGVLDLNGQARLEIWRNSALKAVEIRPDLADRSTDISSIERTTGRSLPHVFCSDAHTFEDLGIRRTWIKMSRPDIEGLRLALCDGMDSVLPADSPSSDNWNSHADHAIEAMAVKNAKYMGRPRKLDVTLNPWLNAIIGGRGTGKSTIVDFFRAALQRQDELPGTLRKSYENRMRVAPTRRDEGLLTQDTKIEVLYRKSGDTYCLSWSLPEGSSIFRVDEDGTRIAEEGNVQERFPVRIYSQKQLFELARNPDALLNIIDDSEDVSGTELHRQLKEAEAAYLSCLASARLLEAQAAELPSRRAALQDTSRKIQILQNGAHATVLNAYRARTQAQRTWSTLLEQALSKLDELEQLSGELPLVELDVATEDPEAAPLIRVAQAQQVALQALKHEVSEAIQRSRTALGAAASGPDGVTWRDTLDRTKAAYDQVVEELTNAGISNPQEFAELVLRASSFQQEINQLEEKLAQATNKLTEGNIHLLAYRNLRHELFSRRERFTQTVSNELVAIRIQEGTQHNQLEEFLRQCLGIERFDEDYATLAQRIRGDGWSYAHLDGVAADLRKIAAGEEPATGVRDRRFVSQIRRLSPEQIDRLALYLPEDEIDVTFRDPRDPGQAWRLLSQGSPGQQTAALLAFVLGYGDDPLILDQPEDDLDNTLIYELVVKRIRETKRKRQVLIVTHNANIVVHGDAELVTSLTTRSGQTAVASSGGLQESVVRDEICRVLEGGPEAFRTRFQRIMGA